MSIRRSSALALLIFGFGIVFAAMPKLLAAEHRRDVTVTNADRGWIWAVPLGAAGEPVKLVAKANAPLLLPSSVAGPLLVCAGADERATLCHRTPAEGGFTHTFSLDEGRRVEGRCLIGRQPATGAKVSVRLADVEARRPFVIPLAAAPDDQWITSAKVDDKGHFAIEHLAPGDYVFEIVTADGRAEDAGGIAIPARQAARPDEAPPSRTFVIPDIVLAEGVALSVEVRAADGAAIPEARVAISQDASEAARARSFERKADGEGLATFHGIDGLRPLRIACAARGFSASSITFQTAPAIATCSLARLGSIKGTVVNSASVPVAGANIELRGDSQTRVVAGKDGSFALRDIAPGTYRLRASSSKTGVAQREVAVAEGETADVGALKLGELEPLHGRVVAAASGEPIEGATVTAVDPDGAATMTGKDGSFTIERDPAVTTQLHVQANGYARAQSSVQKSGAEDRITIRLERPGIIEVTAWNDEGEPCRGCTITAAGMDDVRSRFANERGFARFDGLTPGEYHVDRERVSSTSRQVVVSGGGDTKVEQVRANATTHVELGSSARPFRVRVNPALPPDHVVRAISGVRTATTAQPLPDGSFSFRRTPGESYDLRVEGRGGGVFVGQLAPSFSGDLLTVELGTNMVDIHLKSETAETGGLLLTLLDASGSRAAWARTHPSGVTRIMYLAPGTYTVTIGNQVLGTVTTRAGAVSSLEAVLK